MPSLLHAFIASPRLPIFWICCLTLDGDPCDAARTRRAVGSVGDVGDTSVRDWHHGIINPAGPRRPCKLLSASQGLLRRSRPDEVVAGYFTCTRPYRNSYLLLIKIYSVQPLPVSVSPRARASTDDRVGWVSDSVQPSLCHGSTAPTAGSSARRVDLLRSSWRRTRCRAQPPSPPFQEVGLRTTTGASLDGK